jgi:hypothetical protein
MLVEVEGEGRWEVAALKISTTVSGYSVPSNSIKALSRW